MKYLLLAVAGGLIIFLLRSRVGATPLLSRIRVPSFLSGITSSNFAKDAATLLIAVLLLDWAIYQTGWFPALYDTPGARWGHLAFYVFFGIVLAAAENRTGRVRSATVYMAVAAVAVLGFSHLFSCNDACQLRKEAQAARSARVQTAARHPNCPYRKTEVQFGAEPVLINPAAACSYVVWFTDHCIYMRQAGSSKRLGPFCDKGSYLELPVDVEYIWSADEPFTGFYELRAPRIAQLFR